MGLKPNIRDKITLHDISSLRKMEENLEILKIDEEMEKDFTEERNKELEMKLAKLELEIANKKVEEMSKESINAINKGSDSRGNQFQDQKRGYGRGYYQSRDREPPSYWGHPSNYQNYEYPGYRDNYDRRDGQYERYPRPWNSRGRGGSRPLGKKCDNCPHLSNHSTKECFKSRPTKNESKNE